ncbi:MAG: RHS repeat-associated core domain-containing protein [Verrucomicrobiota bacterium]
MTRNNDLLTVAGSMNFAPTNLTVNGIGATIYNDLTFAVSNGVPLANGLNYFTNVVNGAMTNIEHERLPVTVSQRYDLNGNLVWDGMKAFEYDCANELTRVTVTNGWQTEYAYDGFGRRRVKREYNWTGTAWSQTNEVHYVYDGMNVIQERDGSNNPKVTYTRGLDLSGTMQGAGGIGGLLARSDAGGSAYYHADGNGNITMLTDASGSVLTKYLYDSFGNTLGMWGPLAAANTYRFSSKEIDPRYGIYYYGYRYYEPNQQRWLNRDPIAENGGINLYSFVENKPLNDVDSLGLDGLIDIKLADGTRIVKRVPETPEQAAARRDAENDEISKEFWNNGGRDAAMMAVPGPDAIIAGKLVGVVCVKAARSLEPIAARIYFSTRKAAREAAERASPIGKAIAENGPHGPHYHPLDSKGNQTHDHFYFPDRFW